jgi:hypothetical protein
MELYLQRIMIFAVIVLGMVFAPYVAIQVVDGNYIPFFVFVAFIVLIFVIFGLKGQIWFLIPIASGIGWSLNFLPLGFNLVEITSLLVLGYMVVVVIVMERGLVRTGPPIIWIPLALILVIIFYHWFGTGAGFRLFGGDTFGGRRHLGIVIGIFPYLIILACAYGRLEYLNRVPFVFMAATVVGAIPFILSTFVPSTAGILYFLTGSINAETAAPASTFGVVNEAGSRLGVLGPLGTAMQLWLLSHYRPDTWWRPNRWWMFLLSLLCFFMVIRSGFRNAFFTYALATFIATFLWLRWKSIWVWIAGGVALLIMVLGQGEIFQLPTTMQRSISFLPGKWDEDVKNSIGASDDFRDRMKDVYWREFGWQSPLIGLGFAVDPRETYLAVQNNQGGIDQDDIIRGFILRRDFHEGFLSLWNGTGAFGLVAVIFLGLAFIIILHRNRKQLAVKSMQPIHIWVISYFIASYAGFFAVFGDMKGFYPALCAYFGYLLASLGKVQSKEEKAHDLQREIRSEAAD